MLSVGCIWLIFGLYSAHIRPYSAYIRHVLPKYKAEFLGKGDQMGDQSPIGRMLKHLMGVDHVGH